jgi:small-conductance mechanosensitive channel
MKWSDIFRRKLVRNILLLIPGIVAENIVNALVKQGTVAASILGRLITIYLIVIIIMICGSALQAISEHYAQQGKNRSIPLKGIFQALQILTYFIGGLVIVAVLLNKSPGVLLTGLGASAAVLMLIFKDSILGFVAGVQLSQNKMIQIGDWIQMTDGSANGTVEEITLNTVKVRNWDNTLTMIPPYTLVTTPFKNWRGMQESVGRRVDKMIYIDVNTLQIRAEDNGVTNIQRYREYIESYLTGHPYVNADLDLIITQKEATPYGLPIEVYFFTKEKSWAAYEKQQSEIFDHLMTVVSDFGLQLYQRG